MTKSRGGNVSESLMCSVSFTGFPLHRIGVADKNKIKIKLLPPPPPIERTMPESRAYTPYRHDTHQLSPRVGILIIRPSNDG